MFAIVSSLDELHEVFQSELRFIPFGDVTDHVLHQSLAGIVECAVAIQDPRAGQIRQFLDTEIEKVASVEDVQ